MRVQLARVAVAKKTRRGRPSAQRGTLTRDRVVEAAIALADRGGLEALTVRKLAEALSVTPMAVYNHVEDKSALLVLIFDRVVTTYRPVDHDEPEVDRWLETTFVRMYRAVTEHPSLLPLMSAWFELGPGPITLDLLERCLARLEAAGFDERAAVRSFYVLLGFTAGQAALAVSTRRHFDDVDDERGAARYRAMMERVAEGGHPSVLAHVSALAGAFDPDAFQDELRHQIASLRRSLPGEDPPR